MHHITLESFCIRVSSTLSFVWDSESQCHAFVIDFVLIMKSAYALNCLIIDGSVYFEVLRSLFAGDRFVKRVIIYLFFLVSRCRVRNLAVLHLLSLFTNLSQIWIAPKVSHFLLFSPRSPYPIQPFIKLVFIW